MPSIDLNLEGDGCWPDLKTKKVHHITDRMGISGFQDGMASGKPSVSLRFDLPDGSVVLAETSLAAFLIAADALKARFGDPRT